MKRVLVEISEPAPNRVRVCSGCGALGSAGCDCNLPLLPRVLAAIAETPLLSDRQIAGRIGVSRETVRKARPTDNQLSVDEKRIGADGKARKMPVRLEKNLEKHGWYQRAELAVQEARYAPLDTCPRDAKMKKHAQEVIAAWTEVLKLFD